MDDFTVQLDTFSQKSFMSFMSKPIEIEDRLLRLSIVQASFYA